MNPDDYIEGLHDPNAPFNQEEEDDISIYEYEYGIDALKMEIKKLKLNIEQKRKCVEALVNNIEHLESHTYVKNILKHLFL